MEVSTKSLVLVCLLLAAFTHAQGRNFDKIQVNHQETSSVYSEGKSGLGQPASWPGGEVGQKICNCGWHGYEAWKEESKDNPCICKCLPGYEGTAPNCTMSSKLWDVCYRGNYCGYNSECEMDAAGKRYCSCAHGYFGVPPKCELGPKQKTICDHCGPNSDCSFNSCHCAKGFVGSPPKCTAGPELLKSCDPYPCGPNSGCQKKGGRASCHCLPGYVGEAPNCKPGPEFWRACVKDNLCDFGNKCSIENESLKCTAWVE